MKHSAGRRSAGCSIPLWRALSPLGGHGLDVVRGDDEREVRKRLWEVADLALQRRVVLFGEESQVIT